MGLYAQNRSKSVGKLVDSFTSKSRYVLSHFIQRPLSVNGQIGDALRTQYIPPIMPLMSRF